MKLLFKLFMASILLIGFLQCGNSKDLGLKLERKAPFKVLNATYQSWVAGVAGGGAGITVIITLENVDTISTADYYEIGVIIFRDQALKPEIRQNNFQLIGRYKSNINQSTEFVLHSNSIKEYGNVAPTKKRAPNQFNLLDDEAIIRYFQHGKWKYFKLKLSKKASEYYQ